MIKIEAITLEEAYKQAAASLKCSVTELKIEVVQYPSKGMLGLFKKSAIIVAIKESKNSEEPTLQVKSEEKIVESATRARVENSFEKPKPKRETHRDTTVEKTLPQNKPLKSKPETKKEYQKTSHTILNNTIMPASFVSIQDDEDDLNYEPVYADESYDEDIDTQEITEIALKVKEEINELFDLTCFQIDKIDVSVHDENTLLIEFKGEDAALLIGKEGYRYKALSYMIFNWINTKYQVQLRLEIAEFLKNQEDAIARYLVNVYENIDRDGRAQTKILDGVLVQIALRELRERYADKYVAIRSTRDGLKYIIINDYHSN